ncbi:hypothetical protein I4U23_005246 [Adineta vaga]|nr:hypothetical protein I4U23_005246 [Adineta vaga]
MNTFTNHVTDIATNVLKAVIPDFERRVFENIYSLEKMVKAVEKFETVTIVSIEDAVKSLISLVLEKSAQPKEGLTSNEAAATKKKNHFILFLIILYELKRSRKTKTLGYISSKSKHTN